MSDALERLYARDYFEYLRNRGTFRKFVRKIYLADIKRLCKGDTIDFGCGTGELLAMLSKDSAGLEVNKVAVNFCRELGLHVDYYDPEVDDYGFRMIKEGEYMTFTMNHVLEHIPDSHQVIKKIFDSCSRMEISRIVITVPGYKGFNSDATHRTFIDMKYLREQKLLDNRFYKLKKYKYFPLNNEKLSHLFTHNELRIVFVQRND